MSAFARKTPVLCQASYEKEASLLAALDESVTASLHSITKLGGYMILFQILNVYPSLFLEQGRYPGIAQGLLAGSPFSLICYFKNRLCLTILCALYYVVFFSVTA